MDQGSARAGVNWIRLAPLVIVAIGVVAYANSFQGTLVFDDVYTIRNVQTPWGDRIVGVFPKTPRAIADATFVLNYAVAGARAADYHAVNLIFHIASALLLYGLVRRTATGLGWLDERSGALVAAAAASLWISHPLTTAAVTYVSQRYESLMSMFYLAALYAVMRGNFVARGQWAWYAMAVLACLMGMGTKEVMVTAPVAIALYDWTFLARGSIRAMIRRRWPLYLGLAATWIALGFLMHIRTEVERADFYRQTGVSAVAYAATELLATARYLRLAFWPDGLCFDYGWPVVSDNAAGLLGAGALMTALIVVAAIGTYRHRLWSYPLSFFFLVLAPTGLVARPDPIMEHRAYLALAGVVVFSVGLLFHLLRRGGRRFAQWEERGNLLCLVLAAALVALNVGRTVLRNADYSTDERLWRSTVAQAPLNPRAKVGLAATLLRAGRTGEAKAVLEYALHQLVDRPADRYPYRLTVEAMARNDLGVAWYQETDYAKAETQFREALRLAPADAGMIQNLERTLERKRETSNLPVP